jgi:hypothetical protein
MLDELSGHDLVLSRRRVLSGIAVLGAAGVMVPVGRSTASSETPSDTEPSPPSSTAPAPSQSGGNDDQTGPKGALLLHGQFARIITPDGGGPSSSSADIVDDNGNPIGVFWSAAVAGGGSTTLFHTFQLDKGTLHGQGFGPLEEATFAVVGGTGAYKGARGQYVARQRPVAAGGDGSAEFVFDLVTGKE